MSLRISYRRDCGVSTHWLFSKSHRSPLCGFEAVNKGCCWAGQQLLRASVHGGGVGLESRVLLLFYYIFYKENFHFGVFLRVERGKVCPRYSSRFLNSIPLFESFYYLTMCLYAIVFSRQTWEFRHHEKVLDINTQERVGPGMAP